MQGATGLQFVFVDVRGSNVLDGLQRLEHVELGPVEMLGILDGAPPVVAADVKNRQIVVRKDFDQLCNQLMKLVFLLGFPAG